MCSLIPASRQSPRTFGKLEASSLRSPKLRSESITDPSIPKGECRDVDGKDPSEGFKREQYDRHGAESVEILLLW